MWDRCKLQQLAAQEDAAFSDPRWDRLYLAIERYEGTTHENLTNPLEALRELDAALEAVTYQDIKAQHTGTPVDSIFDRIRDYKQRRDKERRQEAEQDSDQEPNAEAEQKM